MLQKGINVLLLALGPAFCHMPAASRMMYATAVCYNLCISPTQRGFITASTLYLDWCSAQQKAVC